MQDGVNIESVFLLIVMSDYSNAIYWNTILSLLGDLLLASALCYALEHQFANPTCLYHVALQVSYSSNFILYFQRFFGYSGSFTFGREIPVLAR